jgi:hypothetical protein
MNDVLTDLAARINTSHAQTERALRDAVRHAIRTGELLIEAKAQHNHGTWLTWLNNYCEIPERTAQVYMRLARLPIEKRNAVADLPLREALLAIRCRQQRLEDVQEVIRRDEDHAKNAERRVALAPMLPPPPPPVDVSPATPEEIARELIDQLCQAWHEVRDEVSVEVLIGAFIERFAGFSIRDEAA